MINKKKNVPYSDFYDEEIKSDFKLQEHLEDFVYSMETDYFRMWEAVEKEEDNKELSERERNILDGLISFDDYDGPILYINEIARPTKSWYEVANDVAQKLRVERLQSYEMYTELVGEEGWDRLRDAINKYAGGLSLPEGVTEPIQVIPARLRHELEIQVAIDWLIGLGQREVLTLENPEQNYRIPNLLSELKKREDSVQYVKLTMNMILSDFIELREKDLKTFKEEMKKKLGLHSMDEEIIDKLSVYKV